MARIVNMHDAKTQLSRLVAEVAAGEEVVIARAGTPVARLVRYDEQPKPRELGFLRGKVNVLPGFDEYDEEIERLFEGEDDEL